MDDDEKELNEPEQGQQSEENEFDYDSPNPLEGAKNVLKGNSQPTLSSIARMSPIGTLYSNHSQSDPAIKPPHLFSDSIFSSDQFPKLCAFEEQVTTPPNLSSTYQQFPTSRPHSASYGPPAAFSHRPPIPLSNYNNLSRFEGDQLSALTMPSMGRGIGGPRGTMGSGGLGGTRLKDNESRSGSRSNSGSRSGSGSGSETSLSSRVIGRPLPLHEDNEEDENLSEDNLEQISNPGMISSTGVVIFDGLLQKRTILVTTLPFWNPIFRAKFHTTPGASCSEVRLAHSFRVSVMNRVNISKYSFFLIYSFCIPYRT
eukprot:TRINITY_DN19970_c0_g1_i1.p1 TRINITY_DN19970_c0_g1~~TRINITY_DN19970_c0_g1_i1.p1  ORF type:complete len:314 (-),score=-8.77 TRINITY_DN19970_c0_g1_i1:125-1066(-)